jgi:hypothetical protein
MATRLRVATPQCVSGGVLLSHRVAPAVPSALRVLASGFGMCPGVSLALWPPKLLPHPYVPVVPGGVCGLGDLPGPVGGVPAGGQGGAVLSCVCWVSVCWEPQSGREQSLGPLTRPFDE